MSMQSLISGAECATPSNPLSQVLKHAESDRSLQRDRVGDVSSSRLRQLPPTVAGPVNAADLAMVRQFFDSRPQPVGASVFQRPILGASREILESLQDEVRLASLRSSDIDPSLWGPPLTIPSSSTPTSSKWLEEFSHAPFMSAGPSITQHFNETRPPLPYGMHEQMPIPRTFLQSSMPLQFQQPGMDWEQEFSRAEGKGKGKAGDTDLETAFARAAASVTNTKESSRIVEIQGDAESLEDAFERTKISDPLEENNDEDEPEYLRDFQTVWNRLRSSEIPPPEEDLAKLESEFNQLMQAQREDIDFDGDLNSAWRNGLGNFEDDDQSVLPTKFDDEGIPVLEPYKFEQNNPYLDEPASHLIKAKQLLEQNGSLTEAALHLEAAIQQGELGEGGHEAWILLGETRSMDEREDSGMKALTEGVRRAQKVGNNGAGMLSLAISYTNESFDRASHTTLHRWLNARFPNLVPEEHKGPLPGSPWASHSRAIDAFLAVARRQHDQGEMDPDVQIGLGVLFYSNSDFGKAKDCFESALAVRPNDYLSWNRFGSCLSNGSKPEEALGAYREALRLRPTYTRAIYNVGVACLNIGAYKEAAEHFLSALMMQESSGDKSEQLWQTLRRCLLSMDRQDLAERAKAGEPLETFRREGFEF